MDRTEGETGFEDKTENNKAVEISEKDTYERAKTAFATEADSLETQTEYISQTLQNVLILWKQPLVTARKW